MHDDVQMLMEGVMDLVDGRLTHRLVHPVEMKSAVTDMNSSIRSERESLRVLC